jgi:hypothetical protein
MFAATAISSAGRSFKHVPLAQGYACALHCYLLRIRPNHRFRQHLFDESVKASPSPPGVLMDCCLKGGRSILTGRRRAAAPARVLWSQWQSWASFSAGAKEALPVCRAYKGRRVASGTIPVGWATFGVHIYEGSRTVLRALCQRSSRWNGMGFFDVLSLNPFSATVPPQV